MDFRDRSLSFTLGKTLGILGEHLTRSPRRALIELGRQWERVSRGLSAGWNESFVEERRHRYEKSLAAQQQSERIS